MDSDTVAAVPLVSWRIAESHLKDQLEGVDLACKKKTETDSPTPRISTTEETPDGEPGETFLHDGLSTDLLVPQ